MKKSGFTIIELMVVLVIFGIILAVAIPRFMGHRNHQQTNQPIHIGG